MVSIAAAYGLVAVSVLILLWTLTVSRRSAVLSFAAMVALSSGLALLSPERHVGDSHEHVAMAAAIAQGAAPRAPGEKRTEPSWFYAFVAAPMVRVVETAGGTPHTAFTFLNILLLAATAALLAHRVSAIAAVLLGAGPILWWLDKPHPEVFMFSTIAAALVLFHSAPWWSLILLGLATAQEPLAGVALAAALIAAALPVGFMDRRLWLAAGISVVVALIAPLYQLTRTGSLGLSLSGIDFHLPLARELLTTPFDPNVGIFVHAPLLTAALIVALVLGLVRAPGQIFTMKSATALAIGGLFIVMFTQTTNMNSGGTPGPSRYGLWLLPLSIPLLEAAPPAAALKALAAGALVWSVMLFAPARPENYLQPTRLGAALWQRWPAADNPLPEIFSERVSGSQPAPQPPLATPACEKVLIIGRGSGSPTGWPGRCEPETAPPFCREVGVLCYANRTNGEYAFTRLPVLWGPPLDDAALPRTDPMAVAVPEGQTTFAGVGMGAGWSYLEELPERDIRWRWMNDQAELAVVVHEAAGVRLRVDTRSYARPRRLRISMPLGEIATWIVTPTRATFETGTFQLPAGPTVLRFDSLDGADRAEGDDTRRLSVAIFGIRVFAAPQD
jgi:hypothetical protein